VLAAIGSEGFAFDSSAIDPRQLDEVTDPTWPRRLAALWRSITPASQPYVAQTRGGSILELPIAAVTDYATAAEIVDIVHAAHRRLRATAERDVFVVLGCHLETAADYAGRLAEAVAKLRVDQDLVGDLVFTTIDAAAELARTAIPPA